MESDIISLSRSRSFSVSEQWHLVMNLLVPIKQGLPIMDCKLSMNQQGKVAENKKIQFQAASIEA